jgi:uncharacterized membrane protein
MVMKPETMMTPLSWITLYDFCIVWMTSLIWLVQILIYPNFRFVTDTDFKVFHKQHCDRIALLVAPMMIQSFALAMINFTGHDLGGFNTEWKLHTAAIALTFTSTAIFSARQHTTLSRGKDATVIDRLIFWNWPRTLLWTAELALVLARKFEITI